MILIADAPCNADGCDAPRVAGEWCNKHYTRLRKHGDPLAGGRTEFDSDEDRQAANRKNKMSRYYDLRDRAIALLGGVCVVCGTTERLEFDHVDPRTKSFVITSMLLTVPWDAIEQELTKCQLLCHDDHLEKSRAAATTRTHGSISMYQHGKCRCPLCKAAKSEANRRYKEKLCVPRDSNPEPSRS